MAMRWAILRALARSWVIDSAVAPISRVILTIRSLITSAMIGSRPVVGSSKKMISGSAAMARARATRFCMPPESSAGERSPTSGVRPTWASLPMATSLASARDTRFSASSPKATFSHTGRLSNSAAPWNNMPNFLLMRSRALVPMPTTSSPSTWMLPSPTGKSARMHLIITDLPVPEPPMTTTDSPTPTSRSTPFSTTLSPKDLCRLRSRILGWASLIWRKTARSGCSPTTG